MQKSDGQIGRKKNSLATHFLAAKMELTAFMRI
jgi:hypothetical protein